MIDLQDLNDKLGHLTQGEGLSSVLGPDQLSELVGQVGIDPAEIANMAPEDIMTTLSENGVDLSQFAETDIQALIEQVTSEQGEGLMGMAQEAAQNGGLGDMVQNVLGRFLGR
ncbi:MAG: hypothetical protein AAFV45_11140 [Pseudomonadota bacterium]